MPHERYYHNKELIQGETIDLSGDEAKHLRVMRTRPGDTVEIVNGKGYLAQATYLEGSCLKIEKLHFEEDKKPHIIIAQGMPRSNRLDFILEKGCELGLNELWLFPADFSEKTEVSANLMTRMESIFISSMKQCGRLYLPKIVVKQPLKQWSELPLNAYFGDVEKEAKAFGKVWKKSDKDIIFFVGPERGFSDKETAKLKKLHAQGIKLHENILRTDTASITFLSILKHLLLD